MKSGSLIKKVKDLASEISEEVIQYRRHLHQNPELSFEEYNTSDFVAKELQKLDLIVERGVAGTGIVAILKAHNPEKKTIALRADMDALPIQEENESEYKSKNNGVMHACGHDVHTSSLLGTAKILSALKDEFEGTIKFIFQPGEEKLPGGASQMIKAGVLESPKVENITGQHVMPLIPVGKVGFRSGMYMASADEVYLTVRGKGGHAALPELNIDPVLISSHILVALQQIVSRNSSPKIPCVLSFGKVTANGATNVIPDKVEIEGTFRAMDEVWRKEAHEKITKLAKGIAEGMGGVCDVNIIKGYPFLKNDVEVNGRNRLAAEEYLGTENVEDLDLWMGAEDFAFYSQEIPASFYRLGVRNEAKGIISTVHTPTFDVDEECLEIGSGLMAWLAIKNLNK